MSKYKFDNYKLTLEQLDEVLKEFGNKHPTKTILKDGNNNRGICVDDKSAPILIVPDNKPGEIYYTGLTPATYGKPLTDPQITEIKNLIVTIIKEKNLGTNIGPGTGTGTTPPPRPEPGFGPGTGPGPTPPPRPGPGPEPTPPPRPGTTPPPGFTPGPGTSEYQQVKKRAEEFITKKISPQFVLDLINNNNAKLNSNCKGLPYADVDNGKNIYLNNEGGITNCGDTCFFAAALHLFAPVLYNSIVNMQGFNYNNIVLKDIDKKVPIFHTDVKKRGIMERYEYTYKNIDLKEPDFSRIYGITMQQIINIVPDIIIPLITNGTNDAEKKWQVLYAFFNISFVPIIDYTTKQPLIENGKRVFEIKKRPESGKMNKGTQEDSYQVWQGLIENLQALGYCFKYSLCSLIESSIRIYPANINNENNWNLSTTIRNCITYQVFKLSTSTYSLARGVENDLNYFEVMDEINDGGYKIVKLINYSDQLPTYLFYYVPTYNYGIKKIMYPDSLQNIFVKGIEYEVTDIVCHQGDTPKSGHYVCYSKRIDTTNNTLKWFRYDDATVKSYDLGVNLLEEFRNNRTVFGTDVPYYYLFKKVVRGSPNQVVRLPVSSSGSSGPTKEELDKIKEIVEKWNIKVDSTNSDFVKKNTLNTILLSEVTKDYFSSSFLPFTGQSRIIYKARINKDNKIEPVIENTSKTFVDEWNIIVNSKSSTFTKKSLLSTLFKDKSKYNADESVFSQIPLLSTGAVDGIFTIKLEDGRIVRA
jgi:hypothetical protein